MDKVFEEISEIDSDFQGLTRQQLIGYVYSIRYQNSGGNSIQSLEHMHIGKDSASWVRASSAFVDKDGQQRCIMFSDPKLLYHLKQSKVKKERYHFLSLSLNHILLSLFCYFVLHMYHIMQVQMWVDGTFSCVPKPFYQCMIILVFDDVLEIYIPVAYILMTGKTDSCYYHAFQMLLTDCDGNIDPFCVGVDFEPAFFNNVGIFFENAFQAGCDFHFKQALRRKMVDMRIPEEEISLALSRGYIDLLVVIPIDEIETKGIPFVQHLLAGQGCDMDLWDTFFDGYFMKFWTC